MQLAAVFSLQQVTVRLSNHGCQPEVLGVIGNHQKIQRPDQACRLPGAADHFLSASKAIGILRADRRSGHAGVS